jgi:hypothetical protein
MAAARPALGQACRRLSAALALSVLPCMAVMAQQEAGKDNDPPGQAARLSYFEGSVSVQPAGLDDWTVAAINRPLTSGDQLWSERGSRAQIEFGTATVSLAEDSSVTLLELGDQSIQLELNAGAIIVAVRAPDSNAAFEIDAPSAAVSLLQPGSYRIGVDNQGNTTVSTRDGQAQVVTRAGQSVLLREAQAAQFASGGDVDVATLAAPDDFERWSSQHGPDWGTSHDASLYVASDVVGAQQLSDYGDWIQDPDYGYVWYPTTVGPDWAPYRDGAWLWVSPWGWSWVGATAWGYAPFHYGRWAYLHQRWGWVPPPPGGHALYAPALVAWVATDSAVGWLPLAPGEAYLPGYRVSARYLRNVNVSNTSRVDSATLANLQLNPGLQSRYANRNAPRALSVVAQASFVSAAPVSARLLPPASQWRTLTATARAPAIAPLRQSALGPATAAPARRPPSALIERAVVARHPPPPPPVPFDRQLQAMRTTRGRALPPLQLQQLRASEPPRAVILVAPVPQAPRPTPQPPALGRPLSPERHVLPVTPGAAAAPSAPANLRSAPLATPEASPRSTPIDRRVIPERSPQFRAPPAAEAPSEAPSEARSEAPSEGTAPASQPRPPAPPPLPAAQPQNRGKPVAPVARPEER